MKRATLILISVISAVRLASASNNFSYTATAAPGSTPDGTDQNTNPVNVWTNVLYAGGTNGLGDGGLDGSGAWFGSPFAGGLGNVWQIFSYQNDGVGLGGSVDSYNTFAGGALTVGQTVSIDFEMRATDPASTNGPAGEVGVSLMNGTNTAIKFYIYGGGPGWYFYTDAGTNAAKAGAMTYQYQVPFNIAFTVTGPNTYLAVAGSDTWTGTFSGSLTGIDVFNHRGGNASDVGYNHLRVAPQLTINNISPDGTKTLFNTTNTLSFGITSPSAAVNASGIHLTLNGVNVSSSLLVTGGGSGNVTVRYTNLLADTIYLGQINVTNVSGAGASAPVRFDTFSSNYFTWEAEDFDFSGGQFIDNPVVSTNSPSSYYNRVGVSNVDEYVPNFSTNQPHGWRPNDQVSSDLANDTPRAQFTAIGIPDYLVGYFNPSNWVNYTRTFPAGTYNIYGRLANGNGGSASCSLAEVTSGQGTTSQTTTQLGVFQFSARGWNSFDFIPLSDAWGNPLAVTLTGQTTLRVTSGPLGGGVNLNFFMLAPGTNTPPAIANVYPDGSQPFQNSNSLSFTVTSALSTVSTNNILVTLNGANVSSQLTFTGSATNWQVSLPLPQQGSYTATITATDAAGHSHSYSETFDNFSQINFMIEAVDFDFNGGQWIDYPLATAGNGTYFGALLTNSYFFWEAGNSANAAVYNVDFTTTNVTTAETYVYRVTTTTAPGGYAAAGTETNTDFLRSKLINVGPSAVPPFEYVPSEPVPTTNADFDVGWWPPTTWLNYTRTFTSNKYQVYARLAGGNGAYGLDQTIGPVTMSLVTSGQGTMSQTTQLLGTFSDPNANGFQSWHWIPLMSNGTNVVLSLNGAETLKVTAPTNGPVTGSVNAHFYMFVPYVQPAPAFSLSASASGGVVSIKIPTTSGHTYYVYWSSSLNPTSWQQLGNGVSGDGTVKTVTDSTSGAAKFYKALATTP